VPLQKLADADLHKHLPSRPGGLLAPKPFRSLTLLRGRRMAEAYGLREAQGLLKRYVVV